MTDKLPEWFSAAWVALIWFITANIEALPGVWVAAFGGGLLSAMQVDKSVGRLLIHLAVGIFIGISFSKLAVEFVKLNDPQSSRVAVAFLASLFAERLVGSIDRTLSKGDIFTSLAKLLPWGKKQ